MNIQYYEQCVKFALEQRRMAGTTLEEAGLRVYKRYDFNPQAIFSAVGKGGVIMPIISGRFFGAVNDGLIYTVIVMVNRPADKITLYNPIADETEIFPLPTFLQQWIADGSDCITAFKVDSKTYLPTPADLSHIELSDDLKKLGEMMASNAHNVWALERQSEGWSYGLQRNDDKMQTPDMVPYSELPETEKQYDRLMATNTLKYLLAMGYKIEKT